MGTDVGDDGVLSGFTMLLEAEEEVEVEVEEFEPPVGCEPFSDEPGKAILFSEELEALSLEDAAELFDAGAFSLELPTGEDAALLPSSSNALEEKTPEDDDEPSVKIPSVTGGLMGKNKISISILTARLITFKIAGFKAVLLFTIIHFRCVSIIT